MALRVGDVRIRIHPLALMFPLAAARLASPLEAAALLIGLAAHESAHLLAAHRLGVAVSQLKLLPFGAAIGIDNLYVLPSSRLMAVALAGPIGSALALFAGAALAHWRIMPPECAAAHARINLVLMSFNLLPALPLDGGRMLYALLSPRIGRSRAVELGIWAGRAVAAMLLALSIHAALVSGRFNLSPALAALFILASAADERRALTDSRVQTLLDALKPIGKPVPARLWAVSADCRVETVLRAAPPGAVNLYAVYSDSRLSSVADDRRLLEAALHGKGGLQIGRLG